MSFNIEDLFKSIDVIVEQRLTNLAYDQTVIATIVDDSDKDQGHYIVSNGTIKFDAYCANATYRVNDQVRITVLNGDWTQKKFIVDKYNKDGDESAVPYIAPLDNIYSAPFSKNKVIDFYSLETNSEVVVFTKNIEEDSAEYSLQSNGIYDVITLSGNFQTNFGTLIAGGYGIRLDFFIQMEKGSKDRYNRFVTFDSSEMIGNPYNFTIPSHQEKKIVINTSGGIVREVALRIYKGIGYQDDGKVIDNKLIDREGNEVEGEVRVSDLQIGFGTNLINIENNKLQVYTKSPTTYGYNDGQPEEAKEIGLIWYNKDSNNKYIGFSDGIYDPSYDEMPYLKANYQDSRLLAQVDKTVIADDEESLTLAANWSEAKPTMELVLNLLTSDLAQIIQAFGRQLKGTSFVKEYISPLVNSYKDAEGEVCDARLLLAENKAETLMNELDNLTAKVLQYRYNIQSGTSKVEWEEAWSEVRDDLAADFQLCIKEGIADVDEMLNECDKITSANAVLAGYRSVYNSYKPKIHTIKEKIESLLHQVDALIGDLQIRLLASKDVTKDALISYITRDLEEYKNRYCIWWYRYNPSYRIDENKEENKYANFFGDKWERVAAPGLETRMFEAGETIDGILMNKTNPQQELVWSRQMDPFSEYEEYKAILFRNHEKYYSDSITFINTEADKIPGESKWNAADKLIISHDMYSYDYYQVYSQANDLINIKDGSLERQLKLSYDGVLSGTEALAAADVIWYIPLNSTMLTYNEKYLIDKGFDIISEDAPGHQSAYIGFHKTLGKEVNYKDATDSMGNKILKPNTEKEEYVQEEVITVPNDDLYFFYKIKNFYESAATNNTILIEVRLANGNEISGEIAFTFGILGTNGTKYTLAITPATPEIAIVGTENLPLSVILRNAEGNEIEIADGNINLEGAIAYGSQVRWWDQGPNGASPGELKDNLITVTSQNAVDKYIGIVEVGITAVLDSEKGRETILSGLYPVPYSSKPNCYISGPTVVVYNNQGVVSRLSEEPFRLYDQFGKVANQSWSLQYYSKSATIADEAVLAYMPKLNRDNTLRPANMYYEFAEDERIIPVAICVVDSEIAWVQPIVITQNNYASSTLNDWDGSLKIDETNGTILSTMVGAGIKNKDNSFSGVLLGDVEAGANFNIDNAFGVGLYGFHKGAQSFSFSSDGTAFLGKSGRGRIIFDGNGGVIKSASYDENREPIYDIDDPKKIIGYKDESTSGMKIDLDDGQIDMHGTVQNEDGSTSGTKSRIKLDVQSPYLEVTSEAGNKIIEVAKDEYYLQSDNFKETIYETPDQDILLENLTDGSGMKIDLQSGSINSYQILLASKNLLLRAGDSATDYLSIRDNYGKVLLYLGDNNQFIKSSNFQSPLAEEDKPGSGLKIDLANNLIEAYDSFSLRAGGLVKDKEIFYKLMLTGKGSDEDNPYFKIVNNDNRKMLLATEKDFYLQSPNYSLDAKEGFKLDIINGGIEAYSGFVLSAYKKDEEYQQIGRIMISTEEEEYPIQVVGPNAEENYFRVRWDGSLDAKGGNFEGAIHATSGIFDGTIVARGTITGGVITGATIKAKVLKAGGPNYDILQADEDGAEITGATISGRNQGEYSYKLTPEGRLTAANGEMTNLLVKNKLKVSALGTNEATIQTASDIMLLSDSNQFSGIIADGGGLFDSATLQVAGASYLDGGATVGGSFRVEDGNPTSLGGTLTVQKMSKFNATVGIEAAADAGYSLVLGNGIKIGGRVWVYEGVSKTGPYGSINQGNKVVFSIGTTDQTKLTFVNGILVGATKGGVDITDNGESGLPSFSDKANRFLQVNSDGSNLQWTNLYAPTTKGGSSGYVWASNGNAANASPSWQKIGATLVNFTNGANGAPDKITKQTSGTETYYQIDIGYSGTASKTVSGTIQNWYLCWNDEDVSGKKVSTIETTDSTMRDQFDHYTVLSAASRSYSKTVSVEYSGTISKDVKIDVSIGE